MSNQPRNKKRLGFVHLMSEVTRYNPAETVAIGSTVTITFF